MPVVLYGCETWSFTLREKHKLRMSENRVLSKKFGSKREEVTGERTGLHKEELHDPYFSPNIVLVIKTKKNKLGWACSMCVCVGQERCIQGFGGEI